MKPCRLLLPATLALLIVSPGQAQPPAAKADTTRYPFSSRYAAAARRRFGPSR